MHGQVLGGGKGRGEIGGAGMCPPVDGVGGWGGLGGPLRGAATAAV